MEMLFCKFLICSTFMCLAMADFKYLSKTTYLPPSAENDATVQPGASSVVEADEYIADFPINETQEIKSKLNALDTLSKNGQNDPPYGNSIPFGYNSFAGALPGPVPNQGFPGQILPHPVYPIQSGLPPPGFPGPIHPATHNFINPGYVQQAFPPQGLPSQFYPGHGLPVHGYPGQGFYNPAAASSHGYPNYPVYFSPTDPMNEGESESSEDDNVQTRVSQSDTQYDSTNGGYLYRKPTNKL